MGDCTNCPENHPQNSKVILRIDQIDKRHEREDAAQDESAKERKKTNLLLLLAIVSPLLAWIVPQLAQRLINVPDYRESYRKHAPEGAPNYISDSNRRDSDTSDDYRVRD